MMTQCYENITNEDIVNHYEVLYLKPNITKFIKPEISTKPICLFISMSECEGQFSGNIWR